MADRPKDFGRRRRATKTQAPAEPMTPRRTAAAPVDASSLLPSKRTLTIGFVAAGALAASTMHFLERAPARETCVPTATAGTPAMPGPTGAARPSFEAVAAAAPSGGIGGPDPCPPGTRHTSSSTHRSSSSGLGRRSLLSGWSWSSSSSSSSSSTAGSTGRLFSAMSSSHGGSTAAASSISRGGFGSTGGHFSGGS